MVLKTREAKIAGKTYSFMLMDYDNCYTCQVSDRPFFGFHLSFIYDEAIPSHGNDARVKQRFDADVDALVEAGGTSEAMARFVFGNMAGQEATSVRCNKTEG